jgi:DNA ligase (NAD+)
MGIQDIGEETLASILSWRRSNPKLLQEIKDLGLTTDPASGSSLGSSFKGETVVFTGDMETMEREEAQALVERLGGRATSSVSKKTTILVAGKSAGSKLAKARDMGITVLGEQEFLNRAGVAAVPGNHVPQEKKASEEPAVALEFESI